MCNVLLLVSCVLIIAAVIPHTETSCCSSNNVETSSRSSKLKYDHTSPVIRKVIKLNRSRVIQTHRKKTKVYYMWHKLQCSCLVCSHRVELPLLYISSLQPLLMLVNKAPYWSPEMIRQ